MSFDNFDNFLREERRELWINFYTANGIYYGKELV